MKENKYDNPEFFQHYSQMSRSQEGLKAAGEWHEFQKLMPNFKDKRVLDLGCGFGWHCVYAVENGAQSAIGIDLSEKMLTVARQKTLSERIQYVQGAIEDINYPASNFDVVLSSLAFHYVASFEKICQRVKQCLTSGGIFVFSVEHPVFTAQGSQSWHYSPKGSKHHWPVDHYFDEGPRSSQFLGTDVIKYHKTLTTYLNTLIHTGFEITQIVEPQPCATWLASNPEMHDELRRPMMLLVSAKN